jgi:trimeric autotransporter adhesin
MRSRRGLSLVLLGIALCLVAFAAQAQVVKKSPSGLGDLMSVSPRLQVRQEVQPLEQVRSEAAAMQAPGMAAVAGDWDRFVSENGSAWQVQMDRRTGRTALASGSGVPWVPGAGNGLRNQDLREDLGANGQITRGTVVRLAKKFIRQYPELFGVDLQDLQMIPESTGQFGGYLWYVHFQRTFHGIPVERSYVVFRVNNGNLIQFGGEFLGAIDLDPVPSINMETARQIVAGYVGDMSAADTWLDEGRISVVPMAPQGDAGVYNLEPGKGVEYHLVYTMAFQRSGVMGTWEAKVDAHTGEILSFRDNNEYGSIKGGIYITSNLDTEKVVPFPYANSATSTYANAAGVYSQTSGTVTSTLAGKYVKVTDSCGAVSLSGTAPADLSFGTSTGTDCTTPGVGGAGNTHAARTTYYHLTIWKEKAMAWLPGNSWLQGQVGDKVNLSQTCNAYWDGTAVNFFKSGGGCSNTGELPTVFLHEIGHGLDSNDGSPTSTVGSSESYGDTNGILATHSSCLGLNFIPGTNCSGYGNACTSCTGIRDADYTKHSSATPAKPSNLSGTTGYHCSKSSTYPGPCGYEGHCESYIMSEAAFDLAANSTYGLMAKSGMDANTAWFLADRLFFLTRPTAGDSYTCSSPTTANGCGTSNWFMVYLAADDDNGNLSDGTPHGAEIYKAFNNHAIACSTYSSIVDSSTCAISQTAPTLTATPGSGNVGLSWTAASGASAYYVLRNEISSSAGMMLLASTTGTSYTDSMVASGVTYYYSVVGYTGTINTSGGGGACIGKLATVVSAAPGTGATYSISGTVSGAIAAGVTMTLSGGASATTTTATGGTYTFSGLSNGSYTVTPSLSGYTFSPVNSAVTVSSANVTGINFTSTASTVTYSISGTVSGAVTSGVTMTLSGAASATTTTATGGTYTFSGLNAGSYTVTPSLSGYTFSPASSAVTVSSANVTGINFTSTAVSGDTALTSGVGVSTGSIAASSWKYYTIAVPSGATALSITLTGLTADLDLYVNNSTTHPTTSAYYGRSWNSGTTSESLSYTSPTVATWSIGVYGYAAGSGTVTATVTTGTTTYSITGTMSGAVTSGVTMTLSGAASATTTTGTGGTYTFSGLANGTYTVTPSLSGYTFSPTSTSVTISGANQTANFTSTASGGSTTLFSNGFEASTGWASAQVSGTAGAWSLVTSGTYPTCSPHGPSYMAKFNSYTSASGSSTRYYRTSGFAVSSTYTTVNLTFWMYHDTGYSTSADKIQPQVSTNGSTWTSVGTAINRYDGSTGWKQHTVSIATYKGSTVYLGFLATSAYGNNIYLDDVAVVAQ